VQWAVANGAPLTFSAASCAAKELRLDILKWLMEEASCSWKPYDCLAHVADRAPGITQWIVEHMTRFPIKQDMTRKRRKVDEEV
jgi:hypothetical protein